MEPQTERHSHSLRETGSENGNASLSDVENTPVVFSPLPRLSEEEAVQSASCLLAGGTRASGKKQLLLSGATCVAPPAARSSVGAGPMQSARGCALSLELNKSQETTDDGGHESDNKATPAVPVSKTVGVKDIFRSLLPSPQMASPWIPPSCHHPALVLGDLSVEQPV